MAAEPEPTPPLPSYRPPTELDPEMRKRALQRIENRRAFTTHLAVYAIVMVFLVTIWLVTSGLSTYFWPIWPMLGWGLGLALHGGSLLWDRPPTEQQIADEAAKIRQRLGHDIPHDD